MNAMTDEFLRYVRPHWKQIHLVARRYTACAEDARDLAQETLLRAWRSFSTTEERNYSRAWLFVIMRNTVIDWHRAASRRINIVPASDLELTELEPADLTEAFAPLPSMDEQRFREFLDDRIVSALETLDPQFREVIVLSVAGDLNYREIAEALDCPMGTVMSRIARARRALRENLAAFAKQEGWLKVERS